jgi:hypothetical protein
MKALSPALGSSRRFASAARSSVLNHSIDLLSARRDDMYALTHALMYVRDFNILPRRLPRSRAAILAEAEAALAVCLDEQDYDVAGEVLLAWPLTGRSWSPAAAFGFRVLARVEDKAGFLPAPSTSIKRANEFEGDARANYLIATAYHTVYVMGLLCATALQEGRTPPYRIPAKCVVRGRAEWLLSILDAHDCTTHWRKEFAELTESECDALAGLLLNIAIRREIKQRNFSAVAKLLYKAYELGLADTPLASQAAEMLERLALFGDLACMQRSA